jgi:DNA-binding GntR family transcriptional regulator
MIRTTAKTLAAASFCLFLAHATHAADPVWKPLFNGKNLNGWSAQFASKAPENAPAPASYFDVDELERLLSRTSAERATSAERVRFLAIAEGMGAAAASNDDIAFMRLDRELNALLIQAAHNEYASRSMRFLNGHSRRFWYLHYKEAADLPKCARLHDDQARAIAKGNGARAMAVADKLLDYVESFTRATVGIRR